MQKYVLVFLPHQVGTTRKLIPWSLIQRIKCRKAKWQKWKRWRMFWFNLFAYVWLHEYVLECQQSMCLGNNRWLYALNCCCSHCLILLEAPDHFFVICLIECLGYWLGQDNWIWSCGLKCMRILCDEPDV